MKVIFLKHAKERCNLKQIASFKKWCAFWPEYVFIFFESNSVLTLSLQKVPNKYYLFDSNTKLKMVDLWRGSMCVYICTYIYIHILYIYIYTHYTYYIYIYTYHKPEYFWRDFVLHHSTPAYLSWGPGRLWCLTNLNGLAWPLGAVRTSSGVVINCAPKPWPCDGSKGPHS